MDSGQPKPQAFTVKSKQSADATRQSNRVKRRVRQLLESSPSDDEAVASHPPVVSQRLSVPGSSRSTIGSSSQHPNKSIDHDRQPATSDAIQGSSSAFLSLESSVAATFVGKPQPISSRSASSEGPQKYGNRASSRSSKPKLILFDDGPQTSNTKPKPHTRLHEMLSPSYVERKLSVSSLLNRPPQQQTHWEKAGKS